MFRVMFNKAQYYWPHCLYFSCNLRIFFKLLTLLQTFLKVGVYQVTESKQASKGTNTRPCFRLGEFKSKNQWVSLPTSFNISLTGIVLRDRHFIFMKGIFTKVALFTFGNRKTWDFHFSSLLPSRWIFHWKQLRKNILISGIQVKLKKIRKQSIVFFMCT